MEDHNFWKLTTSMDWTSSSQAVILSKMSSVFTLASSITQPICSLNTLPTTGIFFTSGDHTRPSRTTSFWIFAQRLSKSQSSSQTFTSKTTIDLAIAGAFLGFAAGAGALVYFLGLGASFLAGSSSSSLKRLMSSSFFFFSSFFSSFFSTLARKALWVSLGKSFPPTTASVSAKDRYQVETLGQALRSSSPKTPKTTAIPAAREQSAMEGPSPTSHFLPVRCFSTNAKNLWMSARILVASTSLPSLAMATAATAASKSQVVISSHWSIWALRRRLSPPQRLFPLEAAKNLMMVFDEKRDPCGVCSRGRVLKVETAERSAVASWATSSRFTLRALATERIFLYLLLVAPQVLQCSFIFVVEIKINAITTIKIQAVRQNCDQNDAKLQFLYKIQLPSSSRILQSRYSILCSITNTSPSTSLPRYLASPILHNKSSSSFSTPWFSKCLAKHSSLSQCIIINVCSPNLINS